jgi:hypothetical protein
MSFWILLLRHDITFDRPSVVIGLFYSLSAAKYWGSKKYRRNKIPLRWYSSVVHNNLYYAHGTNLVLVRADEEGTLQALMKNL